MRRRSPPCRPRSRRPARSGSAVSVPGPCENFSSAQFGEIAAVAPIGAHEVLAGDRQAPVVCEVTKEDAEILRAVGARVAIGGGCGDGTQGHDGAPLRPLAWIRSGCTEDHYRTCNRGPPGALAGITADRDQAAPHGSPCLRARGTPDDELTTGHAALRAQRRPARAGAGIASHVEQTTGHLQPGAPARIAADRDLPGPHSRPDPGSGVAFDHDLAAGEAGAETFEPGEVTHQTYPGRPLAGCTEQIAKRYHARSVHAQTLLRDLTSRETSPVVQRQCRRVHRAGRRVPQGQDNLVAHAASPS